MTQAPNEATVLRFSPAERALVVIGPAALGIALAVLLPILARWLVGVGFPVLGVVWRVVAAVDDWWKVAIQAGIFAVIGVLSSVELLGRTARVTVGPGELRLDTGDRTVTVPRDEIESVFRERGRLIILDRESRQRFHGATQADSGPIKSTLLSYGYPWRDDDPFTDLYRPWTPGSGELPVAVEAVLAARALAVRKKAGKETTELRESLQKLGYVVRDDGDRQLWRPLVRS